MALKHVIESSEWSDLNDAVKTHYVLGADGKYKLDLGPVFVTDKDPAGLMSALENERAEHAKTKSKFDSIVTERDSAKRAAELAEATKAGEVEKIQKLFEDQISAVKKDFENKEKERQKEIDRQRQAAAESLRRTKATELASELFGTNAPIMLPHVEKFLAAVPGETPTINVINADGTPNLQGFEGLKQTFLTNAMFAPMIVKSKASGGSANEGTNSRVPATQKSDGTARTYEDYKPGELMALKQSNPELFNQLKANRAKP